MSRERRRQYGVCNRTHSLGISQVDDVPPRRAETPAELAEAHRKDAEIMKQVLMEVMVEDGLPVMRAEEAERSGVVTRAEEAERSRVTNCSGHSFVAMLDCSHHIVFGQLPCA